MKNQRQQKAGKGKKKTVNPTVIPLRKKNTDYRQREHLYPQEVECLINAAKNNRYGLRDSTMIMVTYHHGLRASEVCNLQWEQFSPDFKFLSVTRVKNGVASTHPVADNERKQLKALHKEQAEGMEYVFVTERGDRFTPEGFARLVQRAGEKAGLKACHPHQLRHACGFKLANDGVDTRALQAYLGHRAIGNTVKYTEMAPNRFKDFWRE